MRLLLGAIAMALLLVACGGDDSSDTTGTATGTATVTQDPAVSPGQQTPNRDACLREDLEAEVVSTERADDATLITIQLTNTERDCTLEGPPEVRWYDAQGAGTGVPYTPAADCEEDETDYDECVYPDQISLPEDGGTVRALVSVIDVGALIPCSSPTKQAAVVGLQFPGVSLDVQVDLDEPIEFQLCSAQVYLLGYGPVLEG
jgi:hypothetical protein